MASSSLLTSVDRRERRQVETRVYSGRLLLVVIVVLWLQGWLPSVINVLEFGRSYISGLEVRAEQSELATQVTDVLSFTAAGLLALSLVLALYVIGTVQIGPTFLLLVAWFTVTGVPMITGAASFPTLRMVLFPVTVVIILIVQPPRQPIYRLLAALTVITAVASIGFGVVDSRAFMPVEWASREGKAVFDTILAGIYSHSNALGIVLALGLPFVATQTRGVWRLSSMVAVGGAIAWSASRVSMAVAIGTFVLSLIVIYARRSVSRRVVTFAIGLALTIMIALPLSTDDPELMTNRGLIWMTSREYGWGSPLFGHNSSAYTSINPLTLSLNYLSSTGHNTFMTLWVVGGLFVLAVAGIMLIVSLRFAWARYSIDPVPLLFLAVLLMTGIAEDAVRAFHLSPVSFIVYPMLALLLQPGGDADIEEAPPVGATEIELSADGSRSSACT